MFTRKYGNSLKICIIIQFDITKMNNKDTWSLYPKIKLILVWLINDNNLALQAALESQTCYINVLVWHRKYIQD